MFEVSYAISTLSGFVRDKQGQPVANVDLDFFDIGTGMKLVTPGDNTDNTGFYSVTVLNSTMYRVTFAPPQGSGLIGQQFLDFDLTSSQALDVILEDGITISGNIYDSSGNPVGDADLDVDSIGGGRVFTPNDNSFILDGSYSVVVPPGWFRIRYDSPEQSRLMGIQIDSVEITNDTIIDVIMFPGNLLTGTVTNFSGFGIDDVDIDLRDAVTGAKIFTSNNSTDSLGNYSVAVDGGLYQLRFAPSRGSPYQGKLIDSFQISSDISYNETLADGLICTVHIVDSLGGPVAGVDIDVKSSITGEKLFTPNDKTNRIGTTAVAIPAGTYDLQFDPPIGTTFEQIIIPDVMITNDTSISLTMLQTVRIGFSGQVVNQSLEGISGVELLLSSSGGSSKIYINNNVTDSTGYFDIQVPQGIFDLRIKPPRGSHFVAQEMIGQQFSVDSSAGTIMLSKGILVNFRIIDDNDQPVPSTDIDLYVTGTFDEVYTPYDYSDANGSSEVTVMAGVYNIHVIPPSESNLRAERYVQTDINVDTTITYRLGNIPPLINNRNFVIQQNYPNPFNNVTTIYFEMLTLSEVQVDIYNILGQKVKSLTNTTYTPGIYSLEWDGMSDNDDHVVSGIYFYRIVTSQGSETRKLILLK